jgi:hypothetical protein
MFSPFEGPESARYWAISVATWTLALWGKDIKQKAQFVAPRGGRHAEAALFKGLRTNPEGSRSPNHEGWNGGEIRAVAGGVLAGADLLEP